MPPTRNRPSASPTLDGGRPLGPLFERLAAQARGLLASNQALAGINADLIAERDELSQKLASLDLRLVTLQRENETLRKANEAAKGRIVSLRGRSRKPTAPPTPKSVTVAVVKAVIGKLGSPTAAEIADAITTAGAPVTGRSIRFLAERADVDIFRDEDGVRRYRLVG